MGWLRDHGAVLRERAGPFDDVPTVPHELVEREQEELNRWIGEFVKNRQALRVLALSELMSRSDAVRRGRKPTLKAYKEFKRQFLQRWATAVEHNARQHSARQHSISTQDDVAVKLGFTEASELRSLKRGDKKRDAMLWSRFPGFVSRMSRMRWHRNGSITHVWMLQKLMSPNDFETWAATLVPHQGD